MKFYVGIHQPSDAHRFARCMISVNRLRTRRSDLPVHEWMLDSGAFTEISQHGHYRHGPEEYADQVNRWRRCGTMVSASTQDWMCEPFILEKTGKTLEEHQALTIERYVRILDLVQGAYVLPVLQGWTPADYAQHVRDYGSLLAHSAWVGVGSVCRRNVNPQVVAGILSAILEVRHDLRLHGFGLKLTALASPDVTPRLYSSDSMAWSFAARRQGRSGNDPTEAERFITTVQERVNSARLAAGLRVSTPTDASGASPDF